MTVSKTTNSGTSWTRSFVTTTTGFTYSLLVDQSNSNIVYAGGNPGLYKSIDGGTNWASISTGITGYVYAIARDPINASILYAGTPNAVFKTTNGGTSWTNTGCPNVKAVIVDPNSPSTIYAGTTYGVYKSTTGGGNWTQMNQGLADSNVSCIGINPNSYLFAGTGTTGIYRWLFTGVAEENGSSLKTNFRVHPNPAKSHSVITYSLPSRSQTNLSIFDVQGRLVKTIANRTFEPGTYTAFWKGVDEKGKAVPAGVYFYQLTTDKTKLVEKLILLR